MLIESFSLKTATLTSKINADCCSLTLTCQEESKGRSGTSSAKLLGFRSQSFPHGYTKAILLMQQLVTAKGWERQPQDKGYLSLLCLQPSCGFGLEKRGKASDPLWGFLVSFRNLHHLVQEWFVKAAK